MVRCILSLVIALLVPAVSAAQFDTKPAPGAAAAASDAAAPSTATGTTLGKSETQQWEFGVIIKSVGGPSAGLSGTFPVPADWPEQQVKVVNEEISPAVRRHTFRTIDGLKQLIFEIPQLPAGESATCLLTLEVTRSQQLAPHDPSGLVIAKPPPREISKYLGASPFVESRHAKIRALAKELTEGKVTAWQQVEALCDGVRTRIKYEIDTKDKFKGGVGALRDGAADREDMTALFVALCRAHKVPARIVWPLDSCHAEFYLEDGAGKGAWYPCQVHNDKQFGSMNDPRPILQKGDNFRVPEKKDPQRFVSEFLTGKGGGGRPEVEFRRRRAD
ncbi:MAG: transglutaminase-like domain-containing protein [Pirellulaceae bacterium]